jgi:hypothetical protein
LYAQPYRISLVQNRGENSPSGADGLSVVLRNDDENTTIYANFQGADPNKELVEINVRKCCFYPEKSGLNYITVRGFEMAQAASPWTPPTADQPGLLGVTGARAGSLKITSFTMPNAAP